MATLPRLVLAFVCLIAAACTKHETPVEAGTRTGTLLIGNGAEPKDLDPQAITAYTDMRIILALFEGLTGIDEPTGKPVPAGAKSWEPSADDLTWTFHLDPKARWTNGDPVTAADFVYSFRRMLNPSYAAEYAYMLWPLKNARAYNSGSLKDATQIGAEAVDNLTLRLTLEEPCPWLLSLTAHQSWFPVPRATVEKFDGGARQGTAWTRPGNLVGNGAFVLKEWQPNSRIVLERAPGYRAADQVKLNGIVFYPVENPTTEEVGFRAGQYHVTLALPPDKIVTYRAEAPAKLRADPFLSSYYICFNVTKPPLNNAKVRRALALAIDRTGIAEKLLQGSRTPAHSIVPPNTAGYTSRTQVPDDYAAARALLAEAGYPGGRGLPAIELQIGSGSTSRQIYETVQETWRRELGVSVTLAELEQKTLFANANAHAFQATGSGWIGDYVEPNTFLDLWLTGGGNNTTGWSNAEYDRLIHQSQRTGDEPARRELQQQAEAILLGEAPVVPTLYSKQNYLIDPAVRGWTPSLLGVRRFLNIELRK